MDQKKFLRFITEGKKYFEGIEEAQLAFDSLEKLAAKGAWEEKEESEENSSELPVPFEIKNKENAFALFSDGGCRGNPGIGAYGAIGQDSSGKIIFELSGPDNFTTNNKMELKGAIVALEGLLDYLADLSEEDEPLVYLYSDSKYVVDGISSWVAGWKKRGWKKADKKEPENLELWKTLDRLSEEFTQLKFLWVKGHSGHPQNEYCDMLANQAMDLINT